MPWLAIYSTSFVLSILLHVVFIRKVMLSVNWIIAAISKYYTIIHKQFVPLDMKGCILWCILFAWYTFSYPRGRIIPKSYLMQIHYWMTLVILFESFRYHSYFLVGLHSDNTGTILCCSHKKANMLANMNLWNSQWIRLKIVKRCQRLPVAYELQTIVVNRANGLKNNIK